MEIKSPAFSSQETIPSKYTCDGEDISPPLEVSEVPAGAKSLVLIVEDPDAPGGTFDHWLVWNIDPSVSAIGENSPPKGAVQGRNSFGGNSYGGPCPPSGAHRYYFKIYALKSVLNLASSSEKDELERAMEGDILDTGELVGIYQR